MSNRTHTFINCSASTNPATFPINVNDIGNVRIVDVAIPHTFAQVGGSPSNDNDYYSITMDGVGTIIGTAPSGNYQDRQALADYFSCAFSTEETGWPEDVVMGWIPAEGKFIIKTIRFAIDDPDKEFPLPGVEEITIDNTNPTRNIFFKLMGFDPVVTAVASNRFVASYRDVLYKRQYICLRSAELTAGMVNDTRLETDSTSTPPGGANRCFNIIPLDQNATTGRVIARFLGDVQLFYTNILGGPAYKSFTNITIELTDMDGNLIVFPHSSEQDSRYKKWSVNLRFDLVQPVAVPP